VSKYSPAQVDEIEDRRSLISEPLPPDNVISLRKSRPLHAVLVENLNSTPGAAAAFGRWNICAQAPGPRDYPSAFCLNETSAAGTGRRA
jgi:hypothetical protein